VPRVADVFTYVSPILAKIATILTTVETVLDPIASLVPRRLGQCG
jgi:Co/Zn/Cd efflux system component